MEMLPFYGGYSVISFFYPPFTFFFTQNRFFYKGYFMIFATTPSGLCISAPLRPSVKNLQESHQGDLLFGFNLCMISVLFLSCLVVVCPWAGGGRTIVIGRDG